MCVSQYVLETKILLTPFSLEKDRGYEITDELRRLIARTTLHTLAPPECHINYYMSKYRIGEAESYRMIIREREQGR